MAIRIQSEIGLFVVRRTYSLQ